MTATRRLDVHCPARAALAGNPSDGYGGAVVAVPVPELAATVTTEPDARPAIVVDDPDLHRLLHATVEGYADEIGPVPAVSVSATTTIPRSVGLAGSSALVVAALRSLSERTGHVWDPLDLARLALRIERDRLDIAAGLQDRLVQAVGAPVSMHFDVPRFERIRPDATPALFVAWSTELAEPSGVVHRSLRERHVRGEPDVVAAMHRLTELAEDAHAGLLAGDLDRIGSAMNATFDVRSELLPIGAGQREMIDLGRRHGAATNSAGSGGSIIGLARDDVHRDGLVQRYRAAGFGAIATTAGFAAPAPGG